MDSLGALEISVLISSVFVGSIVLSSLGFGIGMVAIPFLLLVLEPQAAVVTLAPAGACMGLMTYWRNRQYVPMTDTIPILIFAVLGSITGVYILSSSDDQILRISIVLIIMLLTLVTTIKPAAMENKIPYPRVVGSGIGYLVAVMMGSMHIGGPLLVLFFLIRGWKSYAIRGSMPLFLACVTITSSIGFLPAGLYTEKTIIMSVIALVPTIIGYALGSRIANRMNERDFRKLAVLLILSSSLLVLAKELTNI